MSTKILINNTLADIDLESGISIPASSQITVNAQDYAELANSDDIYSFIGSLDITVNDGSNDLAIGDAVGLVKSTFINVGDNTLVGPQGPQGDAGPSGFGVYGFSKTAADGTILKARGLNVAKAGTGSYDYSFTTPTPDADYAVQGTIFNLPTNTDTNVFVNNPTVNGFNITIGQGDNGTALDTLMDEIHSIVVLGDAGPQGITSSYESWLNVGNVGTEQDFLDTLVSTVPGPQGVQGPPGDSQIRVSSNDSTVGFIEDKFVAQDNKVSVVTLNDGGDEDIQIGINPSNIGTSELNNDANFIDSAGAPVQPGDIANFEASTQLDTRDTNNRNRANHTGTQLAITISDFSSAVQAAETTTSLSFNSGTNILSFTDEGGATNNIDLSLYLDDTNLSQIISGSLNALSGICTFTRDDLSTFDVDFSSLNDQSFINAAIATHETTIDNHDDVNTSGATAGDLLEYDGANWIAARPKFRDFITRDDGLVNQTTTLEQYTSLSTTLPVTGNYKVSWSYTYSINNTSLDFEAQLELDNSTVIMEHVQEVKDSAGTGVTLPTTGGGTANTSTNQRYQCSGFKVINIAAGARTIDLDFTAQDVNLEPAIYQACLTIEEF